MTPALPLAYAVKHLYSPNQSPYAPAQPSRTYGRRRRRRALELAHPARLRLGLFPRRAAASR
jgi:hypothetical protein